MRRFVTAMLPLAVLLVGGCTNNASPDAAQAPPDREGADSTTSSSTPGPVPWKRIEGDPWPSAHPPLAGLPITLDLIAAGPATQGKPYEFVVRIRNTGGRPVSLDPCPAYRVQYLPSVEVGYLNCNEAPDVISAGAHLDFQMRIDVPDLEDPDVGGSYELLWQLGGEGAEGTTVRKQVPLSA